MDTVIGLGKAGCRIADRFSQYPQYKIYKIDVGLKGLKKNGIYNLPKQSGPEKYEEKCPSMKNFLKGVNGDVLFVVGGSGDVSAASLRILQHIKDCNINILYIRPDTTLLSETKKKHEWVTFNVLQEYTRSGVFQRMLIVQNTTVEEAIGEVSIIGYHDKLNDMIVSTLHMINVYNHIDSVTDTFGEAPETARISTFGFYDLEEEEEKLFFSLDNCRELRYYYAIKKEDLETDSGLFKQIRQQVKQNEIKTSYGIYSTNYDTNFVYVLAHSSIVQGGAYDVS